MFVKNLSCTFYVFAHKHEHSTLLKSCIGVVNYETIVPNEEKRTPVLFLILISTVKNDLKIPT
jgi:hypothetical protein